MKVEKRVLCEERVRRVPEQFSWVDHRLVRDGLMRRCPAAAWGTIVLLGSEPVPGVEPDGR
jgi:hypothetical protein